MRAMRSRAGVGMTPPKVLGAPKPTSSVMMSSTFGAPFGGTTRGGHHGREFTALRLISPANFGTGEGRYLPSIIEVAAGEPGGAAGCSAGAFSPSAQASNRSGRQWPDATSQPSSAPSARAAITDIFLVFIALLLLGKHPGHALKEAGGPP
jgi:hypothetical protein